MIDTPLFLAIAAGSLAGILYGQRLSERILARVAARNGRRLRELRCVFCCGRVGGLLTALPTFILAFSLPQHLAALPAGLLYLPGVASIGVLTAALLTAALVLGASLGAAAGKAIASFSRDSHPANHPA
jgi:hypothetical protein